MATKRAHARRRRHTRALVRAAPPPVVCHQRAARLAAAFARPIALPPTHRPPTARHRLCSPAGLHPGPVHPLPAHQGAPLLGHVGGIVVRRPPPLLLCVHVARRGRLDARMRHGRYGERLKRRGHTGVFGMRSPRLPRGDVPPSDCAHATRTLVCKTPLESLVCARAHRHTCCTIGSRASRMTSACGSI